MTQTVGTIQIASLVKEKRGHFKIGIPCPIGMWPAVTQFRLAANGTVLSDAFNQISQLWPDGSVKWLLCEGLIDLQSHAESDEIVLTLDAVKSSASSKTLVSPISNNSDTISLSLNNGKQITINKTKPFAFATDNHFSSSFDVLGINSQSVTPIGFSYTLHCSNDEYTAATVEQKYKINLDDDKKLVVEAKATIFISNGAISGHVTVRNPSAASHPHGKWDLGDPNSIYLNECCISLTGKTLESSLSLNSEVFSSSEHTELTLHQASSGFENWQSPVHVTKDNVNSLPFRGFKLYQSEHLLLSGEQAEPRINFYDSENTYSVQVDKFWQNFPSSAELEANTLSVSILGSRHSEKTELQPGEQKTRSISIAPFEIQSLQVVIDSSWLRNASVLPFLPSAPCKFDTLIKRGIEGPSSFYQKRLDIDEFGWRHFGELYADHEKALAPDEPFFVSHYNNQYDPIFGMLTQWLLSADSRWFELADDLAKHVADIDVYHTNEDKPEYSGGLFWHTDHYVQAYTASHRTYSKHQPTGVYDDHAGGGGPGGQHCYTNGLTLHYLLTGYAPSRDAALSIAQWVTNYYEGDNTFVGALLALKNSEIPGVKNVKTGKYPLDRGTGNYLQARLDRYELQGCESDIDAVSYVIAHTVSPFDDFSQLQLDNVEATWFYTVFLQAVCRFISLKEQRSEYDSGYQYAVDSLTHYANWMTSNEYAYLDKPEILEFPNQTWSGQDLRKLCVLNFASNYLTDEERTLALQKVEQLAEIIYQRLSTSNETSSTRILCLMMQNAHYSGFQRAASPLLANSGHKTYASTEPSSSLSYLLSHLAELSPSREKQQLVKRFPQLQKWLGKP
ncbi:hypothetical protein [Alteromonas gracilis]|uniref:hypothetical protein n=1 Tax=Alteromonas gracilis TaxID=1479524 RepID=UPI0037350319